jgi:sortase B
MILKYPIIGIITCIKLIFSFIYHFFYGLIIVLTIIPKYLIIGIQCLFSKEKQQELKMTDKIIPTIIITLSLITYLISIFILTRWYVQNERNKNLTDNLNESTKITNNQDSTSTTNDNYKNLIESNTTYPADLNFLNINLNSYINTNSETIAWIQVNGTNISYPVVQHSDNNYYLEHDFYKRKTNIGWVFADYRDEFDPFNNNTIFYAHNLVNRTMFGQLPYLLKNKWQSNPNNYYIKLSTKKTNSVWQIFSVYKIKPTTDYLQSKFNSTETYQNFLTTIKNRSSFNFNTDVSIEDKIITLSTCDDIGTQRIAVHAKLLKIENK